MSATYLEKTKEKALTSPFVANVRHKANQTGILNILEKDFLDEEDLKDYFVSIYHSHVELEQVSEKKFKVIIKDRPDVNASIKLV